MARPTSKMTKFILALPRSLPAKEVLAKAKASGMKTSESNVHRVRRLHRGSKAAPSQKLATARAKSAPRPVAGAPKPAASRPAGTKSDFVRALPRGVSAKEVVAQARAAGITLDVQYVYKVRARRGTGRRSGTPTRRGSAAVVTPRAHGAGGSAEELLRAAAAEVGLGRAIEILEAERSRVRHVLGG